MKKITKRRTYLITVTLEGANPNTGLTTLSGDKLSEIEADKKELQRRLLGSIDSKPRAIVEKIWSKWV